jgi:membrane protein
VAGAIGSENHQSENQQKPGKQSALRQLGRFWIKINRDWMFNLSGMLAYNLLLASVPLLILSISVLGIILQHSARACSATSLEGQIITNLASVLPNQITGLGREHKGVPAITVLCNKLSHESLLLAAIGVITGLWFGSRLFVKMENSFGVIFRLRSRSFLRQNGIAIGMTALFAVLGPLSVFAAIVPERLLAALGGPQPKSDVTSHLIGSLCGAVIAFLLLELIYVVVPNQRIRFRDVWGGALVSALLLSIYELVFPLYEHFFISSNSYGAVAGLIVIVLLFFYYFAIIILLGAEINSWYFGHQESSGDVATVLAQATGERPPKLLSAHTRDRQQKR